MIQDMLILHEPPTSYRFCVHQKPVNWGSLMPDIVVLLNVYSTSLESFNINFGEENNWN